MCYRHRRWLLYLAHVCASTYFIYARGRLKKIKTVKCLAKYLDNLFLPPVHSISCIDNYILSFTKRKNILIVVCIVELHRRTKLLIENKSSPLPFPNC